MKNLLKNKSGFTLVEVVVAAGLLGVIALGVTYLLSNVNKSIVTAESKSEEVELRNHIMTLMKSSQACAETLVGLNIGDSVTEIKNSSGTVIYEVGNKYGNGAVLIEQMELVDRGEPDSDGTRLIDLNISFKKTKKLSRGNTTNNVNFPVKVKASGPSAVINECFYNADNTIETAMEQTCNSLNGIWDDTSNSCQLNPNIVMRSGPNCNGGEVLIRQYRKLSCSYDGRSCLPNPSCGVLGMNSGPAMTSPGDYWEDTLHPDYVEPEIKIKKAQGKYGASDDPCVCEYRHNCTGTSEYQTYCLSHN